MRVLRAEPGPDAALDLRDDEPGAGSVTSTRNSNSLFACRWLRAPATMNNEGLADVEAASPFRLPRLQKRF